MLIGEGQVRQQGGDAHVKVALVWIYMPEGQRTVRVEVDAGDSRPSGNTTRTFQIE